jgi:hypothetical protein
LPEAWNRSRAPPSRPRSPASRPIARTSRSRAPRGRGGRRPSARPSASGLDPRLHPA